jgi:Xaa-Pro aminopeptidase
MRRAQAAAEAAMDAARDMFRRAEPNGDALELEGAPLTVERVKSVMSQVFAANGTTADEFIVAPGPQGAVGHDMGSGPIRAGVPIVIDIWPRDEQSGCFADMTRTFVAGGEPAEDVARWHELCEQALERVYEELKPGATGRQLFETACDVFEQAGELTQRTKPEGEPLRDGFFHSLGHGVGLEVHEDPSLGRSGKEGLVPGDVLAIEPGCYRNGYGGVRVEDLALVTDDGYERLTDYPYGLAP